MGIDEEENSKEKGSEMITNRAEMVKAL